MRPYTRVLALLGLFGSLSLGGCAAVLHQGGPETVTITSEPSAAQVIITNAWTRQRVLQAMTPAVAALARHAGYMQPARYHIVVTKPGYHPYAMLLQAQLDEHYFGNLVAGGPIGFFLIDPLTGAMYDLPPRVHAVLAPADGTESAPAPPVEAPYPAQPSRAPEDAPYPPYRPWSPEERIR